MARALQSKIFPGARIEARSRLKSGADIKVLLGSDLLAQPLMLASLSGEERAAPSPAVQAATPETGPPPRSTAVKAETAAPAIVRAPATPSRMAESQAPPLLPAAAGRRAGDQPAPDRQPGRLCRHCRREPADAKPARQPQSSSRSLDGGPRRGWSRHLRLLGQIEETSASEADLDAIRKACQGLALGEAQLRNSTASSSPRGGPGREELRIAAADNCAHHPTAQRVLKHVG